MENFKDHNHLIISRKTISIAIAVCILMEMLAFVAGYFWGYRKATADVQVNLNKTNFTDQINYTTGQQFAGNGMPVDQVDQADASTINPNADNVIVASEQLEDSTPVVTAGQQYYAELIGFGSSKTAQAFVDKMQKRGYTVIIRKRVGKNSKGKTTNWYQAITENFDDKDRLVQLVEAIKQTERLQGIKIKNS